MTAKSYAKVNIFLKIAAKRDNYHELVSRFVRVKSLYDTISFEPSYKEAFNIIGNFGCKLESNTVYKAYNLIKNYNGVEEFFKKHDVVVEKNIPEFAGLGGGSSNAATFLLMVNEVCNLNLSKDELNEIGQKVGADVPFFIYEYDSANVTGIGEIVEKFDEESLDIETITPKIMCDTGEIFGLFRKNYYKQISTEDAKTLLSMKSIDVLNKFNIKEANDLYEPAIEAKPQLEEYENDTWFFSGSGSSFFKINGN